MIHTRQLADLSLRKLIFLLSLFLVIPVSFVYAGFFSLFDDVFSKVTNQAKFINSQNISLLSATIGPNTAHATTTDETITVDESALLADVGPVGGLPDVDNRVDNHGQISVYVVRAGDTVGSIAQMHKVSVNTIIWANDIPPGGKIIPGATLVILPISGVQYIVKKGDTIASIAKKYKGDVEEIRSYNGLSEDAVLSPESIVIIPDGEIAAAPTAPRPAAAATRLRSTSGPSFEGYYRAPLSNYRKTQGLHGYNGVDLVSLGGAGSFVSAAASGDVIISKQGCKSRGCNGGYGNYIVIKHSNGTQTLYAHLKSTAVSAGEYVVQGQLIGYEGNSGRSTGTHLHFEIRGAKNPF